MEDADVPVECQVCGRRLPAQKGRGRLRRYCNATCRSAARRGRQRELSGRAGQEKAKGSLTGDRRHVKLDAVNGAPGVHDPVAITIRDTAIRLVAELARPGAGSPLAAVAAARELSTATHAALQAAVDWARAAGHSWQEIGDVLGTTRQAAFQRFGHPVDLRTGTPMSRVVPPDATQRATAFLGRFVGGRWEEVLEDFDDRIRQRHDVHRLAGGWAHMIGMFGSYQSMGEVSPVQAAYDIVVDVLLRFGAGEAMLMVRFDRDGKVAGLRLHPASR